MILALEFATPLLLLGVLAAAIPFILHLLSSIRAPQVSFPTLRFLKASMEKTARRRHVQHWLLLLLRAAMLAILALAVAEPISRASKGILGGDSFAAVLVLDTSYSMDARNDNGSRLAHAKAEAAALLGGDNRPAAAAVLTSCGQEAPKSLGSQLDPLRKSVASAAVGYGPSPLALRVRDAAALLHGEPSLPHKALYLLSDMQRQSFEELLQLPELGAAKDLQIFVINTAKGPSDNVGITNLEIQGGPVVDQMLQFVVTLANSSPTDKKVDVSLRIDGGVVGQPITKTLRAAGQEGSISTVRFFHRFGKAGPAAGDVVVSPDDDLPVDNVRRFSMTIAPRLRAAIVRGPGSAAGFDAATAIRLALDPYGGDRNKAWSVVPEIMEPEQFGAGSLKGFSAAFFCEWPSFTAEQAKEIIDFAAAGGTVVFFLGDEARADNYNKLFVEDLAAAPLLPAPLLAAVGEVGPSAQALPADWVDVEHPIFKELYENAADYLTILAQRYYKLGKLSATARPIVRLKGDDVLLAQQPFGGGQCFLCGSTAAPRWNNLAVTSLFLPMLERMSLLALPPAPPASSYTPGAKVRIVAGELAQDETDKPAELDVTLSAPRSVGAPGGDKLVLHNLKARWIDGEGYVAEFDQTAMPGLYRWQVNPAANVKVRQAAGAFAVNPIGSESDLRAMDPEAFKAGLQRRGLEQVYVAKSLKDATDQAVLAAKGRNWWDLLLAVVIVLLVAEAVIANRRKNVQEAMPPEQLTAGRRS